MARKDVVSKMKDVLIKRRDALRKALVGDFSLLNELRAEAAGDLADFALDSAQDEITSQLAEVESRELASIETALERMRDGTYGVCDGCNASIPAARLQALPYANCCIECQRQLEKSGISRNGPVDWSQILDTDGDTAVTNY